MDKDALLQKMRDNPKGIRFNELKALCMLLFGQPRQSGSSHCIFSTPWQGDPRINIQNDKGMAKPYQVRQVLKAIEKLNGENDG